MDDTTNKVIATMLGRQIRKLRESRRWTRPELIKRLPKQITEHTLLTYENGIRHCTLVRLVEICRALQVPTADIVHTALQLAEIDLEISGIRVDLHALLNTDSPTDPDFLPLRRWAHNRLADQPDGTGIVRLAPETVRDLAAVLGCSHSALVTHLLTFTPDAHPTRTCSLVGCLHPTTTTNLIST